MSSKVDKHELIASLVRIAQDLGKTPSRDEFVKQSKISCHHVKVHFGSYATMVQAAGLDPVVRRKVDNTVFDKSIDKHLDNYVPHEPAVRNNLPIPTIASISDIHWPFSNAKVIKRYLEYVGDLRPQVCVLNGDAWDMYSHTKFPRSHNQFTPREEEQRSRTANEEFWKNLKRIHPEAQCYQMLGNHDVRPMKRIIEVYPEAEDWIKDRLTKMFEFEGVKTIMDPREELIFGNVVIHHGYRSKLGDHRDYMLMNSINGHTHRGGTVFRKIRGEILWELNSGLAGDPEAKGLTYTPQKISDWSTGFGAVDKWGPRFIPVE